MIAGYKITFKYQIPKQNYTQNYKFNQDDRIEIALEELIKKGAIIECAEIEGQILSSYFLIKKPDGSDRLILNLKYLNEFVDKKYFMMEDIRSATQLIFPGDYMGSIDLEDAFFIVPLHKESRKYVCFKFKGKTFEFTCLPFSLCTAPFVFTKIMKIVVNNLRGRGFISVIYLDDILCIEFIRSLPSKYKGNQSITEFLRIYYKRAQVGFNSFTESKIFRFNYRYYKILH